ncbi:hypothetical protein SAICODRAFT_28892 [Saitoella complicata NRRL Y-17804]|uniref:Uncharacterized protein n=1 Tax=Saitoella complicata (strain BCRC 22490 / CBS 7301 / JCM 7358 / NBRC 10748 / NRRL Y-17804) TaxID=698492 RepID=A0A0E9NAX4_SAICN|nr:uncharacterized protein SAICODRAFT_28892 [Saitoella complicata NRRL Y-17804]ODQ55195.1 hypothetical protein SAICODRAFT_28892 [Saitoella complicata NRRL Y-17804]GAO47027.1 hypothetical protein G7K_1241-t1 [Saitoella complicata NRRL Y-17804]
MSMIRQAYSCSSLPTLLQEEAKHQLDLLHPHPPHALQHSHHFYHAPRSVNVLNEECGRRGRGRLRSRLRWAGSGAIEDDGFSTDDEHLTINTRTRTRTNLPFRAARSGIHTPTQTPPQSPPHHNPSLHPLNSHIPLPTLGLPSTHTPSISRPPSPPTSPKPPITRRLSKDQQGILIDLKAHGEGWGSIMQQPSLRGLKFSWLVFEWEKYERRRGEGGEVEGCAEDEF